VDSNYSENLLDRRNHWLAEQIRQMSVDTLSLGTYICTACGEVSDVYIIDYSGKTFRLSDVETYALLKFILEVEINS
jgi:hypothetical protein